MKKLSILLCLFALLAGCDKFPVSKDEKFDKSYAYVTGCHPNNPDGVRWTQYNENGTQDSFTLNASEVFPVYKVSPGIYYATEINIKGKKINFATGNSVFVVIQQGYINYIGFLSFGLRDREVSSYLPGGDDDEAITNVIRNHPSMGLDVDSLWIVAPAQTGNHKKLINQ